ncbi:MAG TPA: hypothetical protein VNO70_04200 [Blastocatellia bacterium]|nr:hypothetical protein [Blastocatellia bacterium]
MSKEQLPPVREVKSFKPGKRVSTFRRLNIDFAGTALEQALAEKERLEESQYAPPAEAEPQPEAAASNVIPYTNYHPSPAPKIEDSLAESASPTESTSLTDSVSLSESASPTESVSLSKSTSPVKSVSLAENVSLADLQPLAHRGDGLTDSARLTDSVDLTKISAGEIDLMKGLPKVRGHLKLHNQIIDYLYPQLDPAEQAIHLQLYRLSWGYGKPTCLIGLPKLAARAGMGMTAAAQAVKKLIKKGLIKKLGTRFGKNQEQGVEYWIRPPHSLSESVSPTESVSLADSEAIKENNSTLKDTPTKGSVGVGGKSKFSLEECRRYAEYLKSSGEGITNPGGFATSIHRTGERDAQIEAWLQAEPTKLTDISQCPDCQGVGFLYPNGIEGGVVKCKHPKLRDR